MLSTPVVFVVVLVALAGLAATRRLPAGRWLAISIYSVYLVGVAHFALLPLEYVPNAQQEFGPIDLGRLVEVRPFFISGGVAMPASQAWLNVLLTAPFGFGLPFVLNVRGRHILLIGVLFSLGIEGMQLLADALYLALPTWSVDINDVILNSLGVFAGYAVFRLTSVLYRATVGRMPVRRGPWAHFHDTLAQAG